ncbi:MAG: hypothetical protein MUC81_11820 [Bacteroidia bacterium]|jgi:hypothetical protein|nr:hypothetical protein [Bacteroidia bacterium]
MADSKINEIKNLLSIKSSTKQFVFRQTQALFRDFKMVLRNLETELNPLISEEAPHVEVKYSDKGDFEAHLKFSGDTLVLMMHTNVFDFDQSHHIHKTKYVQDDPMREFCGLIQIYNFLSDSIKYNRENDIGYLIGRVFINKDSHFFIDGKRPLSFLFSDIEKNIITPETMRQIIEESMLFCLNFDLMAPPVDAISYISVDQKNMMGHSSGMPTAKRLGFTMEREQDNIVT